MEPLRGGALASPPPRVKKAFDAYSTPRLPYEWALRFVLDRQEVSLVLSGMGSARQVWENAAVASAARANSLTMEERAVLDGARRIYSEGQRVACTTCGYCQPCPTGVPIPELFGMYNAASMFDTRKGTSGWYKAQYLSSGHGADSCIRCGECLAKCPQGIAIPDRLEEAHAYLTAE
jgi:predicted aldo/keto reductase-like oxidoreductase